jgi:Ca2+-binding EF-hand superfamily protein
MNHRANKLDKHGGSAYTGDSATYSVQFHNPTATMDMLSTTAGKGFDGRYVSSVDSRNALRERISRAVRLEGIKNVFTKCDSNADGHLSFSELRELVHRYVPGEIDAMSLTLVLKSMGGRGDGLVAFDEFKDYILKREAKKRSGSGSGSGSRSGSRSGSMDVNASGTRNRSSIRPSSAPAGRGSNRRDYRASYLTTESSGRHAALPTSTALNAGKRANIGDLTNTKTAVQLARAHLRVALRMRTTLHGAERLQSERFARIWATRDREKKGMLCLDDFKAVLVQFCAGQLTSSTLQMLLEEVRTDGEGHISLAAFRAFVLDKNGTGKGTRGGRSSVLGSQKKTRPQTAPVNRLHGDSCESGAGEPGGYIYVACKESEHMRIATLHTVSALNGSQRANFGDMTNAGTSVQLARNHLRVGVRTRKKLLKQLWSSASQELKRGGDKERKRTGSLGRDTFLSVLEKFCMGQLTSKTLVNLLNAIVNERSQKACADSLHAHRESGHGGAAASISYQEFLDFVLVADEEAPSDFSNRAAASTSWHEWSTAVSRAPAF